MNYGDIKSHFDAVINRSDITPALTTLFIDQGIARIQRQLRTPMSERVLTVSITTQTTSLTLPADFLEIVSLYYDEYELQRVSMQRFRQLNAHQHTGKPQFFCREGAELLLYPQPTSGDLVLYYHAEFPQMVNNADENALAKSASDLIIYSAATFAADYYLDERAPLFEAKYQQILDDLQNQATQQELQGGTQIIQPSYRFED